MSNPEMLHKQLFTCAKRVGQLLILSIYLTSCGGGGGSSETPVTPPPVRNKAVVVETIPAENDVLINIATPIDISFDRTVDLSAINASVSISPNVDGQWSFDATTNTARFTPAQTLSYFQSYTVSVSESPSTTNGNVIGADYSWSFQTQQAPTSAGLASAEIVILDLTQRNGSSRSSTNSVSQALDIMGMPYVVTEDPTAAISYPIIITSSYISTGTLADSEKILLADFVENGGVLVSSSLSDQDLFAVYGVSDQNRINTRSLMNWNVETDDGLLAYFDDPKEITVSLGKGGTDNIFSRSYTVNTATEIAQYDDNSAAIVSNQYGSGTSYLLGLSFTDIILRNQMNMDYSAQRSFMNDFEPTTDTFMLFLRAIYNKHTTNAVWKHTSPDVSESTLIVTHDIDSQSSADWVDLFADLEQQFDVSATYNVTTHYISDERDGDFYTMNIAIYQSALGKGHVMSSHSVGHFPDFNDDINVPKGGPGNTMENYQPSYHDNKSTNATVYGELEVSKDLLEDDLSVEVITYRSGHLAYNKYQTEVLEELGYKYDSSFAANDSLTNFPFRLLYGNNLSGPLSSIYTFPLAISDSTFGDTSAGESAQIWLDVLVKNTNNNAPTVLLIHPNRDYKLAELEIFLQQLPEGVVARNMDAFGDYWAQRDAFDFNAETENNALTITLKDNIVTPINSDISLRINDGMHLNNISVLDHLGNDVSFQLSRKNNDLILHQFAAQ